MIEHGGRDSCIFWLCSLLKRNRKGCYLVKCIKLVHLYNFLFFNLIREKEEKMSVMKWILNLGKEGNFEALNEQTSCLTSNDHGPNFLSNVLVSCCQRVLFHCWFFSISLLLLQNWCRRLSGLYGFNWQTYLSSAGLDRNISHSEAAPVEDGSSPRKFENISFKGPVCHPLTVHSTKCLPISGSLGGFFFLVDMDF